MGSSCAEDAPRLAAGSFTDNGKTYIGSSAGSVILAKNIEYIGQMDDKTVAKELCNYNSIGAIDFCILPHYLCEPFIEVSKGIYNTFNNKIDLRPLSNNQAIVCVDNDFILLEKQGET